MDLDNGRVSFIRQKSEAEATFIRGIRPSPLRNYVVVLLKAQCVFFFIFEQSLFFITYRMM